MNKAVFDISNRALFQLDISAVNGFGVGSERTKKKRTHTHMRLWMTLERRYGNTYTNSLSLLWRGMLCSFHSTSKWYKSILDFEWRVYLKPPPLIARVKSFREVALSAECGVLVCKSKRCPQPPESCSVA